MRTEAKVFGVIALFMLTATGVYMYWTGLGKPHPEWAGTLTLGLGGVFSVLIGGYCALVARRIPPRPEDRPDAEIADGAGPIGFFAPPGFWPLGIALSVSAGAIGIATSQWWLLLVGAVAAIAAIAGLVMEFYAGSPESR
ncbi:cytochrome c oxidase subunit 4 [Dactylosporangium salmoneum]|uniref:Cytochrome c oxidase polypeptide 4 n=1 Tax=Dactylosporangium salmoneum TaxID=53361 RepID=A0ABN3H783_9ACTN